MISLRVYSQIKGTPVRSAIAKCILSQICGQAMMLFIHVLTVYQVSLQMRAAIPVVSAQEGWIPLVWQRQKPCAEVQAGEESAWHSSDAYCPLSKIPSLPVAHKLQGLSHACLALKRENKQWYL